jgi:pyridoxamine 5'-phosphate oxidase
MSAESMRVEYSRGRLVESEVAADPFAQFRTWFDEATAAAVEPNAMTLATCTPDGRPSARVVLLKGFDERGFSFYTNYQGRKARDIGANPRASLVLFWQPLERQVRIGGRVEKVSEAESDQYFAIRPRGAQLGAWASVQSEVVPDRGALEASLAEVERRFGDGVVPRPPHWGGYRVVPDEVEFWQGRPNRLHDRLLYLRTPDGWDLVRLAP